MNTNGRLQKLEAAITPAGGKCHIVRVDNGVFTIAGKYLNEDQYVVWENSLPAVDSVIVLWRDPRPPERRSRVAVISMPDNSRDSEIPRAQYM
jgi:hypothetical protein